jgi:CBS-domain-containing membrane protein
MMKHRMISSVMTPAEQVISVRPETLFKEIAGLLEGHRISAVPVLDDDLRVIGIVSEADLLAREDVLEELKARAVGEKAVADTAAELMTSPAVTISAGDDVVLATRIMQARKVKRLPVTDPQGRLVGIVSRRDVLRVFLRSDGDLHADVAHLLELVGVTPGDLRIQVRAGVVHLSGELPYQRLAEVIGTLTRQIDGVVDVVNRLTYASNDTGGAEPHAS